MKIQNNNAYSIMFGMNFIKAGEVIDVDDKTAESLLKQPNVVEYVSKEQITDLEEKCKELEAKLAKATKPKAAKPKAKK